MDWWALTLGVSVGTSINWFIYGYLLFKRIDILWEYALSLDRSVNSQGQMIRSVAVWTNFVEEKEDGTDEVSDVPEGPVLQPEPGPSRRQAPFA